MHYDFLTWNHWIGNIQEYDIAHNENDKRVYWKVYRCPKGKAFCPHACVHHYDCTEIEERQTFVYDSYDRIVNKNEIMEFKELDETLLDKLYEESSFYKRWYSEKKTGQLKLFRYRYDPVPSWRGRNKVTRFYWHPRHSYVKNWYSGDREDFPMERKDMTSVDFDPWGNDGEGYSECVGNWKYYRKNQYKLDKKKKEE